MSISTAGELLLFLCQYVDEITFLAFIVLVRVFQNSVFFSMLLTYNGFIDKQ